MKFNLFSNKTRFLEALAILVLVAYGIFAGVKYTQAQAELDSLQQIDPAVQRILDQDASVLAEEMGVLFVFTKAPLSTCLSGDPLALLFLPGKQDGPIKGCWHSHKGLIVVFWEVDIITVHSADRFLPYQIEDPKSPPPAPTTPLSGPIALN